MTNKELLLGAGVADLQNTVATRQRRFTGHVLHLPTTRPVSLMAPSNRLDSRGKK